MCLAIPAKILEIDGNEAKADFGGITRPIRLDLVEANVGDYVVVHVGYAIEVMDESEALESIKLWSEILSKMEDADKRL